MRGPRDEEDGDPLSTGYSRWKLLREGQSRWDGNKVRCGRAVPDSEMRDRPRRWMTREMISEASRDGENKDLVCWAGLKLEGAAAQEEEIL